jgi:hypothetical protein
MMEVVWGFIFFVLAPSFGMLVAGYVCSVLAWPRARQVGRAMGWIGISFILLMAALYVFSAPLSEMPDMIPFVAMLAAVPTTCCGVAIMWNQGDRKPDYPTCAECGYNLTGLVEARCPECGKPFDPGELNGSSVT